MSAVVLEGGGGLTRKLSDFGQVSQLCREGTLAPVKEAGGMSVFPTSISTPGSLNPLEDDEIVQEVIR